MYSVGDIVYLYLFDIKKNIELQKKIMNSRFGKIIKINKVEYGNKIYNEYIVELRDKNIVTIKDYVKGFNLTNITDLKTAIYESNKIDDNDKDKLIEEIDSIIKKDGD